MSGQKLSKALHESPWRRAPRRQVALVIQDEHYEAIKARADEEQLSVGTWLKRAALKELRRRALSDK